MKRLKRQSNRQYRAYDQGVIKNIVDYTPPPKFRQNLWECNRQNVQILGSQMNEEG